MKIFSAGLMVVAFGLSGGATRAADIAAGQQIYSTTCHLCHQIGPGAQDGIGPQHNGLIGRKAGSDPHFSYSDAMKNSGIVWNQTNLAAFIDDPQKVVPGNRMPYAGLHDPAKAADVAAYMAQFQADGSKKSP